MTSAPLTNSVRAERIMGTTVTIDVVRGQADPSLINDAIDRAFGWFREIEQRCTRFIPTSELMQLSARIGQPVPVSSILYEALHFALMVAEETEGAFDLTVGHRMAARGFNREHRTGEIIHSPTAPDHAAPPDDITWRDVALDPDQRTVTLRRPLTLDLGAVAKGLAVDTAARELQSFRNFAIDAGGDLYLGGSNPQGRPWTVGIRHPRRAGEIAASVQASNQAVCTSGDYERPAPTTASDSGHHILDPRTGASPQAIASVTVIADSAMLADALATAAFVLGPQEGLALLHRMGVSGLILTPDLQCFETGDLCHAA